MRWPPRAHWIRISGRGYEELTDLVSPIVGAEALIAGKEYEPGNPSANITVQALPGTLTQGYQWGVGSMPKSAASSNVLVTDKGFALLWPQSQAAVGVQRVSVKQLRDMGWTPMPGDVLYICTDANTTRSNKITHVVLVLSDSQIVHARGTNYGVRLDAITLYDGKIMALTRYIEQDAVLTPLTSKPAATATQTASTSAKTATVTCQSLNVRTGPGTEYGAVATLHRDDRVELTGKAQGKWREIRYRDGKLGWCSDVYLKIGG